MVRNLQLEASSIVPNGQQNSWTTGPSFHRRSVVGSRIGSHESVQKSHEFSEGLRDAHHDLVWAVLRDNSGQRERPPSGSDIAEVHGQGRGLQVHWDEERFDRGWRKFVENSPTASRSIVQNQHSAKLSTDFQRKIKNSRPRVGQASWTVGF